MSVRFAPFRRGLERKLVWILGSPRSGSTWLYRLLLSPPTVVGIHEPLIGMHVGLFASVMGGVPVARTLERPRIIDLRDDDEYVFAAAHVDTWAPALGRMMLCRFADRVPRQARHCVVHEPNGSEGADAIMRAVPRSRLLFLVRDGRDVVDSMVDASRSGTWLDEAFGLGEDRQGEARLAYVSEQAARWRIRTEVVQRAYDHQPAGLRHLVRYEDLLADTVGELTKIYRWLDLEEPPDLADRVAAKAFAAMPATNRGPGKFYRAATPGLWREHLTPQEQQVCAGIMGRTLETYGYDAGSFVP
jgi:LPS sulfotransferase NodH